MNTIILFICSYLSFTVGPARVDKALYSAEEVTEVFEIQNLSDDSLRIRVTFEDFIIDEHGNVIFKEKSTIENSVASFSVINPEEFIISPRTVEQVRMTFRMPSGSIIPEYYGMLFFQSQPVPTKYSPRITVAGEIGVPIYYSLSNLAVRMLVFDSLNIKHDTARVVLQNTGNTHVRIKGESRISTFDGMLVAADSIPEFVILPKQMRKLPVRVPSILEKGTYRIRIILDYGALELLEGERVFTK